MNLTAIFTLKIKLLWHGPLPVTGAWMLALQGACSLLVGKRNFV